MLDSDWTCERCEKKLRDCKCAESVFRCPSCGRMCVMRSVDVQDAVVQHEAPECRAFLEFMAESAIGVEIEETEPTN